LLKAAIVGATGIVGQQFIVALKNHPWIEIVALAASERSVNRSYRKAITDTQTGALRWFCKEAPIEEIMDLPVHNATDLSTIGVDIVFSAVESGPAKILEPLYAATTPVVSTASAFRYENDVPIIIPGINPEHMQLLKVQQQSRGWKGFIAPQPNCTTVGLAISLKPILQEYGLNSVIMTSMQAISGAGRSPGVLGLDIMDNIIPYIPGEEEKVQFETQKILGSFSGKTINPAAFKISTTCTRVNVRDGHTESVFFSTQKPCNVAGITKTMREFSGSFTEGKLPSVPENMILVRDDPFRPQPRLDCDADNGMATVVGRIRKDDVLENGIKYILVSHNTKMGAARGAVLTAEVLIQSGYIS
jgi:aspartate-semialdehyde dehydrogenase